MASSFMVTEVKITLKPGYEEDIFKYPQVKGYVTRLASDIASTANALSSGFRTGYFYNKEKKKRVGGTQPHYVSEKAMEVSDGCVAIIHPKNYAAMKDNYLHNTLLKSMRKG